MLKNIIGHEKIKEKLRNFKDNFPSIILFSGPRGVGKKFSALNLIDELYLGTLNVFNHPDIKIYSPDGNTFKIDAVHDIQKEILLTPFELNKKFFILSDIDKMNKESSNASLKMFEDVPKDVHFILTCENTHNVLKTILSRSSVINFSGVPDIDLHYPNISSIESKLANGCIGKIADIKLFNLENKYNQTLQFFNYLEKKSYSDILDFQKITTENSPGTDILVDLLLLCSLNIAEPKKKSVFLKEILRFKEKLKLNLNHNNHLKLCLLNIKKKLESTNV